MPTWTAWGIAAPGKPGQTRAFAVPLLAHSGPSSVKPLPYPEGVTNLYDIQPILHSYLNMAGVVGKHLPTNTVG